MKKPYKILLVIAVLLTACMLYMEYNYWDNDGTMPSASTIAFECAVFGSFYALLIWGVLSGLYFLVSKALGLISGTISKQ